MKKFYPFMAAALLAVPSASQAQSAETVRRAAATVKNVLMPDLAKAAARAADDGSVWRAGKSSVYEYDTDGWIKQYDHTFTYNAAGCMLTDEATAADGSGTLTTNTYDALLPSYTTLTTVSTRTDAASAWGTPSVTLRREVTHDSEGRITRVAEYDGAAGEYDQESIVMTMKYDSEGKACELSVTQYGDSDGSFSATLANIKWHDYDYESIFSLLNDTDGDDLGLTGEVAGKMTSADITLSMNGITLNGTFTGTYTDNGFQQTMTMKYMYMTVVSVQYDMTYTDEYGSCVSNSVTKSQEGNTYERQTITCNQQGDRTAALVESGSSSDKMSTREGYTYDYTYDNGRVAEVVTSEWEADGEPYTLMSKTVYSAYTDVAAGIGTATFKHAGGDAAVYTLGGCRVGTSTEKLGKGIYIVRQGSSTKKVTVK